MIFSLFKKKPTAADQLQDFMNRLNRTEARDLGLSVATIEHVANSWWVRGDFYEPRKVLEKHPDMIAVGLSEAQRLQASGLEALAVGWIVWVHTFRAVQDASLLPLAKSMWALIIRGAPYAHEQAGTLEPLLGFELQVDRPERVPVGFQ